MKYFENKGFVSHGVLNITPAECFDLIKHNAAIVDIREEYLSGFKMFDVGKIVYLPYSELLKSINELPDDIPLIIADSVGLKSRECCLMLQAMGYENVANLAGGIVEWEKDGLPVTIDKSARLTGSCMCQLKKREGVRGKKKE